MKKKTFGVISLIVTIWMLVLGYVSVNALSDDYADDTSGATVIQLDNEISGQMDRLGDKDFFSFTAAQSGKYHVSLTIFSSDSISMATTVYDQNGKVMNPNGSIDFVLSANTKYYLEVSNSFFISTYGYKVKVTYIGDDYGDSIADATLIQIGTQVHGSIGSYSDADYFKIITAQEGVYIFELSKTSYYGPNMILYDSSGTYCMSDNHLISKKLPANAEYYIRVGGYSGSDPFPINYSINLSFSLDEYGNDFNESKEITIDNEVTGKIDYKNDIDLFKFVAPKSEYVILKALSDPNIVYELYDFPFSPIDRVNGSSLENRTYKLKLNEGKTYYIGVGGSYSDTTGSYQFTLTGVNDDYGNDISTAYPVDLGTEIKGSLQGPGDVDFFSFKTTEAEYYSFNSKSVQCSIFDSNGKKVEPGLPWNDFPGFFYWDFSKGPLCMKLQPNQTYYIKIYEDTTFCDYSLKINEINDDYSNTLDEGKLITTEKEVKGAIEVFGDTDCFIFTPETDGLYFIKSTGWEDVIVSAYLYDNNGSLICQDYGSGGGGDFLIKQSLKKGNTYKLKIVSEVATYGLEYNFGNYSFTITKSVAPVWSSDYPAAGTSSSTSVQVQVKMNGTGMVYYVCLPSGSTTPSALQVKKGTNALGIDVTSDRKGSMILIGNTEGTLNVFDLTTGSAIDIYIVADDCNGNLQLLPVKVSMTTKPETGGQNADLSELSVSGVTLSPEFSKNKTNYNGSVSYGTDRIIITAVTSDPAASSLINGKSVAEGNSTIMLNTGNNTISVEVTAHDGVTKKTYVVNIYRSEQASNDTPGPTPGPAPGPTVSDTIFPVKPANPIPNKGTVTIAPIVTNNIATTEIGATDYKALIDSTTSTKGIRNLTINVDNTNSSAFSTQFPAAALTNAAKEVTTTINTAIAKVEIPSNMFDETTVKDAKNISINISKFDKSTLPASVADKVGNALVLEISATVDGKAVTWNNYDAPVKISIPYTLKDGENSNNMTVYYIDGNGNLENMQGVYNADTKMVTFTTTHFSMYAVKANKILFADLSGFEKYTKYIESMASKGIIEGIGNNKYSPSKVLTRAEFATLLVKMLKLDIANVTNVFADVKASDWYAPYVNAAYNAGIISGVGASKFAPDEVITNQDAAIILVKALKYNGAEISDESLAKVKDVDTINKYALDAVGFVVSKGIVTLDDNSNFKAKSSVNRASAAEYIYNVFYYKN